MVLFQFYLFVKSLYMWAFERLSFFAPRSGRQERGYPIANCWGATGRLNKRPSISRFIDMIMTMHPNVVSTVDLLYNVSFYARFLICSCLLVSANRWVGPSRSSG